MSSNFNRWTTASVRYPVQIVVSFWLGFRVKNAIQRYGLDRDGLLQLLPASFRNVFCAITFELMPEPAKSFELATCFAAYNQINHPTK